MFALSSVVVLLLGAVDPQGIDARDGSVQQKDAGEHGLSGDTGFTGLGHLVPKKRFHGATKIDFSSLEQTDRQEGRKEEEKRKKKENGEEGQRERQNKKGGKIEGSKEEKEERKKAGEKNKTR